MDCNKSLDAEVFDDVPDSAKPSQDVPAATATMLPTFTDTDGWEVPASQSPVTAESSGSSRNMSYNNVAPSEPAYTSVSTSNDNINSHGNL